jgi:HK97 gp10 family phage protein
VDYARYVEFGTSEMNAQPFLTPSALRDRGEL